jgi:hypothetical protein
MWVAGATLGAGLLAGGFAVRSLYWLPDPAAASQEELLRWVALRDLAQYPRETQVTLVNRLQEVVQPEEFKQGETQKRLQSYAPQIRKNAELLKKVWFETRCRQYATIGDAQRFDFLRQQLDAVFDWATLLDPERGPGQKPVSRHENPQLAWRLIGELETWIDEARGEQKGRMEQAVRDAVVCWLSTTDLAANTFTTRRDIAARLAAEFSAGNGISADDPLPVTGAHQDLLQENAMLLIEAWLHDRAEAYAKLEPSQQEAFVDRCLDDVQHWNVARYLPAGSQEKGAGGVQAVLRRLPEWIERAESQVRGDLLKFVAHVQQRVVLRAFRQVVPRG